MKRVKRTGNSVKVIRKNNKETTPKNGTSSYSPTLWPVVSLHPFHLPLAKAVKESLVSREIQKQLLSFRTSALSQVSVPWWILCFITLSFGCGPVLGHWILHHHLQLLPNHTRTFSWGALSEKPATQVQTWHMQIGKILSHDCWGSFGVMKPSPCTHIRLLQISIC